MRDFKSAGTPDVLDWREADAPGESLRKHIKDFNHRRRLQLPRADHSGNRPAWLHLAQVIKMALDETSAPTSFPDRNYVHHEEVSNRKVFFGVAVITLVLSLGLWRVRRTYEKYKSEREPNS